MNQIFCFKRYVLLLKRQWFENETSYKLGIALMALMVGVLFGLFLWISTWTNTDVSFFPTLQMGIFAITGIIFLYKYGANFFNSLTSKNKKMFYFSLPVSAFERVVVTFSFVLVFMPILILTVFSVFDFIAVQLFNQMHSVSAQMFFKSLAPFGSLGKMFVMILSYMSYASVFTLGSLMFGKKGPIITIVFLIVYFSFYSWFSKNIDADYSAFIIDFMKNYAFIYLLPISWTAIYFVMKRKET